jgi:hypothetical protein
MDVLLEIITLFGFKVALKVIRDTCDIDTGNKLAKDLGKFVDVVSL